MPCDQEILTTTKWHADTSLDLLAAVLEEAGYSTYLEQSSGALSIRKGGRYGTFRSGTFSVPQGWDMDALKPKYSAKAVQSAAKKLGWHLTIDAKNPNKMQMRRRY